MNVKILFLLLFFIGYVFGDLLTLNPTFKTLDTTADKTMDNSYKVITPIISDNIIKMTLKLEATTHEIVYRQNGKMSCICIASKKSSSFSTGYCASQSKVCFDTTSISWHDNEKELNHPFLLQRKSIEERFFFDIHVTLNVADIKTTIISLAHHDTSTTIEIPAVKVVQSFKEGVADQIKIAMIDYVPSNMKKLPSLNHCEKDPTNKVCQHQDELSINVTKDDTKCKHEFVYEIPTLCYAVFVGAISGYTKLFKIHQTHKQCNTILFIILQLGGQICFSLLACPINLYYAIVSYAISVALAFAIFGVGLRKAGFCKKYLALFLAEFLSLSTAIIVSCIGEDSAREDGCVFAYRNGISVLCGSMGLQVSIVQKLWAYKNRRANAIIQGNGGKKGRKDANDQESGMEMQQIAPPVNQSPTASSHPSGESGDQSLRRRQPQHGLPRDNEDGSPVKETKFIHSL